VPTTPGAQAQRQTAVIRYLAIGGAAVLLTVAIIFGVVQEEPKPALNDIDQARAAIERGDLDSARRIVADCKSRGPCLGGDALINAAQRQVVREAEKAPVAIDPAENPEALRAERQKMLEQADALIAAGNWNPARALLADIKIDGVIAPDAKKKLELMDAEQGYKMSLDQAQDAIAQDKLEKAKSLLESAQKTTLLQDRWTTVAQQLNAATEQLLNNTRPPGAPKINPNDGPIVKKLLEDGRNQMKAKDYQASRKSFTDCLKVEPKAWDCAKLLGSAYAKLNDPDKSVQFYKKYLELAPSDDPGRSKVKEILQSVGR
jgi:tetratricopeptide (TPR) repeat protein